MKQLPQDYAKQVFQYIHAIRNPFKREYAEHYANYLAMFNRGEGDEPEYNKKLSYMGAQAVRMHLSELYRQAGISC
jgi:hypothetical protein